MQSFSQGACILEEYHLLTDWDAWFFPHTFNFIFYLDPGITGISYIYNAPTHMGNGDKEIVCFIK